VLYYYRCGLNGAAVRSALCTLQTHLYSARSPLYCCCPCKCLLIEHNKRHIGFSAAAFFSIPLRPVTRIVYAAASSYVRTYAHGHKVPPARRRRSPYCPRSVFKKANSIPSPSNVLFVPKDVVSGRARADGRRRRQSRFDGFRTECGETTNKTKTQRTLYGSRPGPDGFLRCRATIT